MFCEPFFKFQNNPVCEKTLEIRGIKTTFQKDLRILLARLLFKKLQNVKKIEFEHTKITIKVNLKPIFRLKAIFRKKPGNQKNHI